MMQNQIFAKPKSVVLPIVIVNIIAFIVQMIVPGFTQMFMLVSTDIFSRPWILFTSMFLHGSVAHIFFNMYVLLMFGSLLEQRIGSKRFLFVYIMAGLVSAFVSSFFYPAALGASGAIMGVMGIIIMILPHLKILLFFIIPMPLWVAAIVIALIETFGIFVPSNIANIAHLTGMAFGLLYGLYLKKQKQSHTKRFSKKKHLSSKDLEEYFRSGRI